MANVSDEGKVGRVLGIDRVKELNSKDWFYRILKENPNITGIYPGVENEILRGAIDHHIHAYPDFVNRAQDMIEVTVDASRAGMRAVGFKDHFFLTSGVAYAVQKHIDHMVEWGELENKVEVYGGLGLNLGMSVEAVRMALRYPNTKMLWFPTFNSAGFYRSCGKTGGIALVDERRRVLPEVEEIMRMAAEARVGIGFGHTDYFELRPLAEKARELGARAVLDHPLLELNKLTLDEMQDLAELGVYVGTYCQPMIPSIYQPLADPFETVETIKAIGASRCIAGSDFGQVLHVDSIDGVRIFIRALLAFGIPKEDVELVLKDNPAKLLYLD